MLNVRFQGMPLHALHVLHGANGRREGNAHAATTDDQTGLNEIVNRAFRIVTSGRC